MRGWSQVAGPRHHRFALEVREWHRLVGELVGAGHEHVGVFEELDGLDVVVDDPVVEQQVEVTDPRVLRLALGEPHLAGGMLLAQPAQQVREDHGGDALERADVEAASRGPEPLDAVGQVVGFAEQPATTVEDQLPQRRQPDGTWPAGPIEDRAADGPLQRRDLLAHRGLGVAQPVCRSTEGAFFDDRVEGA